MKDKFPKPEAVAVFIKEHEVGVLFNNSIFMIMALLHELITTFKDGEEGDSKKRQEIIIQQMTFIFLMGVEFQKSMQDISKLEEISK